MYFNEVGRGIIYILYSETVFSIKNDIEKIMDAFSCQGIDMSDVEEFSKEEELRAKIKENGRTMKEGELHVVCIIASVENSKIVDEEGSPLKVRGICEDLKGTGARIMILLELLCSKEEILGGISLNEDISRGNGESKMCKLFHPHSTDMLLAYLPRQFSGNESSVKIFCDELNRSLDITEVLAAVTAWAKEREKLQIPMYSSTMREKIQLRPYGVKKEEERSLTVESGKAYAFLVESFEELNKKSQMEYPSFNETKNERTLFEIFEKLGFTLDHRGKKKLERTQVERREKWTVGKRELLRRVEEIVADQKKDPSPLLSIVITSHGTNGGFICCSDDELNIQDIMDRLSRLDRVQKLIIIDACRGCGRDKPVAYKPPHKLQKSESGKGERETPGPSKELLYFTYEWNELELKMPFNTLLVMTTTEGNVAYAINNESPLLEELWSQIGESRRGEEVDVFDMILKATKEVAEKAKQQVAFASTLTKPLRFKVAVDHVTQS